MHKLFFFVNIIAPKNMSKLQVESICCKLKGTSRHPTFC